MIPQEPKASDVAEKLADGESLPQRSRHTARILTLAAIAALLGAGVYDGIHRRAVAAASLATATTQTAIPIVDVVHPHNDATDQELVLPGQTMAFTDTPIYARTSGYLKHWYFDIGAHVRQGQLLAQIETPELDAQLNQARADLETAQANARLAGITAQRTAGLLRTQSISTQERDNAAGAYTADQAIVASRQAEVARLQELQSYENVYAPFDGEITTRNTDVGDLINAGAGAPTTELFHMAATRTLRIFAAVPEIDSPAVHVGAAPTVTLDEYPGQMFQGHLMRSSGAINPVSRTLLVEVDVDNADGKLLPGAYAFVHFTLPGRTDSVTVPSNALLFRSEGLRVGVVRNGKVDLVPITIGRDYGDRVEVLSGVDASDQIIVNPSDSLMGGADVRLANEKSAGTA
ncbi:MAG: efflux RND transporter periplasmic adaptor subunit [Acetobacteraceae bacterium]|nr:efflux RND transporter periplasmic adaptor subunit [Acetobacteraceae bacterium]